MANTTLAPMQCMCGKLLQPKKGVLMVPRTISCSQCGFTFKVVRQSSDSASTCLDDAEKLADRGTEESFGQAVALCSIGLAIDTKMLALRFARAFALDKLEQYSTAIPDWKACMEGGHRPASSATKLGSSYACSGQYKEAVGVYDRILSDELSNACQQEGINRYGLLRSRGMALAEIGDFDKAMNDLMGVKRVSPSVKTDYWILVCRYRGDKERAQAEVTSK